MRIAISTCSSRRLIARSFSMTRLPFGEAYSPETTRSASLISSNIRLQASTYECPAPVSDSCRVDLCNTRVFRYASNSQIFRLTVAKGIPSCLDAPEKLPASITAISSELIQNDRSLLSAINGISDESKKNQSTMECLIITDVVDSSTSAILSLLL